MNVLKNMEAIFLVTAALALVTGVATAAVPASATSHSYISSTLVDGVSVPVVNVVGKLA